MPRIGEPSKSGNSGKYERADLDRAASDALIREALESQGVGAVRRGVIYSALRAFGWPELPWITERVILWIGVIIAVVAWFFVYFWRV
jgi:hypothetical protein